MLDRCYKPVTESYPHYGGRGITVCSRWREPDNQGFLNFLSDMGECPAGFSLERKRVNGNYTPGNCTWADAEAQSNNKRNTVSATYRGRTQTLARWAREIGISHGVLSARLKAGWSTSRAFTTAVRHKR